MSESPKSNPRAALHGECIIKESAIPASAKRIAAATHLTIAKSTSSGNDHVVVAQAGVEFFEHEGVRYMRNAVPATVRCLNDDRHGDIEIPVGEWAFGIQQEYDYLEQQLRDARD